MFPRYLFAHKAFYNKDFQEEQKIRTCLFEGVNCHMRDTLFLLIWLNFISSKIPTTNLIFFLFYFFES